MLQYVENPPIVSMPWLINDNENNHISNSNSKSDSNSNSNSNSNDGMNEVKFSPYANGCYYWMPPIEVLSSCSLSGGFLIETLTHPSPDVCSILEVK